MQQSTETEINTSDESAEKEVSKLFGISVRKFSRKKKLDCKEIKPVKIH